MEHPTEIQITEALAVLEAAGFEVHDVSRLVAHDKSRILPDQILIAEARAGLKDAAIDILRRCVSSLRLSVFFGHSECLLQYLADALDQISTGEDPAAALNLKRRGKPPERRARDLEKRAYTLSLFMEEQGVKNSNEAVSWLLFPTSPRAPGTIRGLISRGKKQAALTDKIRIAFKKDRSSCTGNALFIARPVK